MNRFRKKKLKKLYSFGCENYIKLWVWRLKVLTLEKKKKELHGVFVKFR